MQEQDTQKLRKIQKQVREGKIDSIPTYEISDFCYEFVIRVARVKPVFISNESTLYDFPSDVEPEPKNLEEYWFYKIRQEYGIDLNDAGIQHLNVAQICNELEKRLEKA